MSNTFQSKHGSSFSITQNLKSHRKLMLCFLFFSILILFFVSHDSFLYKDYPIGKVISIRKDKIEAKEHSTSFKQYLKIKILNGTKKGAYYTIENTYTPSSVKSAQYHVLDQLILEKTNTWSAKHPRILSLKRDTYFAGICLLFVALLLLFIGKRTLFLVLTFMGNMFFYILHLYLYQKGIHLGILTCFLMFFQTVCTMYFLNGRTIKVRLTICASLLSICLTFLIYIMVTKFSSPLPYYMFDYLAVSDLQKQSLFMASVLFGGLGAVMDVSITICSMATQLHDLNLRPSLSSFLRTLRKTGVDIIGTMQCVLLFSYLTSAIPMMAMKLASGSYIISVLKFDFSFELVRFLIGAIAIVLSVLVSIYLCSYYYYGIYVHKYSLHSFLLKLLIEKKNESNRSKKERTVDK